MWHDVHDKSIIDVHECYSSASMEGFLDKIGAVAEELSIAGTLGTLQVL